MEEYPEFISPIVYSTLYDNCVVIQKKDASLTTVIRLLQQIFAEIENLSTEFHRYEIHRKDDDIFHYMKPALKREGVSFWIDFCSNNRAKIPESPIHKLTTFGEGYDYCYVKINILLNQMVAPDGIILDFEYPISGSLLIRDQLVNYVSSRIQQELNWNERKHYMELVEGCPSANGHIARFLFDNTICREVSTYLVQTYIQ